MENTQTRQLTGRTAFEDVWAALLVMEKHLKEAIGRIRETDRKMWKIVGDLKKGFGKTHRKIDDMFIPRLERQFGVMGFVFDRSAERTLFGNREYPSCHTEIDVFLEDCYRAVAVAVKSRPCIGDDGKYGEVMADLPGLTEANIDDIRKHIERMKKLRRHFDMIGDYRKLYGAVAAAVFPANVLDFALQEGFYVIKYAEDNIEVRKPEDRAKAW
jgi:hypothetical protein